MTAARSVTRIPTDRVGALMRARDLHLVYGSGDSSVEALRGCSLTLDMGEILAIVGPSGSGKSSLLHVLAGIEAPTSGVVELDGTDLSGRDERERARWRARDAGFVLQRENLIPSLTVEENVAAPMMFCGLSRRAALRRARAMLAKVELGGRARAWPSEISGGEAQRAAIARACANDPRVIFADEPTGALDSRASGIALELFSALARETGAATLLVTHDMAAAGIADRRITLRDGRIVE